MSDPAPKSIRQAERMIHAVRCAHASIEAARCRFALDLREIEPAKRARSLHRRLWDLAINGSLREALRDLEAEITTEPLESVE